MRRLTHDVGGTGRLAFSPDGRWLYGQFGETLAGWDLVRCDASPVWSEVRPSYGLGEHTRIAVAPDGLTAAACGAGGGVVVFDLD
ncbi:MAG TPA: hypothetical protein VH092_25790 [Urbifossiella sp.]|jgi:hypothetical protein|nr:hypothetical protein [Urbifossiella sp.]